VFPVSRAPIANGVLIVTGSTIASVEPAGTCSADIDLGNVAILPGLVNAHTHLDLTGMRGLAPPGPDFTGWLRQVIAHRRARTPQQVQVDIRAGLAECIRTGTTLLGDISSDGSSWEILASSGIRAVVFHEMLGLSQARADATVDMVRIWLGRHSATRTCRPGLSPHAPYSVRADLVARAAMLAQQYEAPLAIHLAETRDELELLRSHQGPFVTFLQELGVWDPDGLAGSVEQMMTADAQNERTPRLFIHGNYLPADTSIQPNHSIIYCPRTHLAFDHAPHPFQTFRERGQRVALGTDSLASNPDLDLLAEARFLHRQETGVSGATLLRMLTLAGAEALGWADETGSLEPGKSADLIVVELPDDETENPHDLVLGTSLPVRRVLSQGYWLVP
jgi:cytosine/adenosine deaminase-related metal-dependent hydrolase